MGSWISLPEAHSILISDGWRMLCSSQSTLTYEKCGKKTTLDVRIQQGVHLSVTDLIKAVDGIQMIAGQGTDMVSMAPISDNGGSTTLLDAPESYTSSGRFIDETPPSDTEPTYLIAVERGNCDQETIDRFFRALARYESAVGGGKAEHIPLAPGSGGQR